MIITIFFLILKGLRDSVKTFRTGGHDIAVANVRVSLAQMVFIAVGDQVGLVAVHFSPPFASFGPRFHSHLDGPSRHVDWVFSPEIIGPPKSLRS